MDYGEYRSLGSIDDLADLCNAFGHTLTITKPLRRSNTPAAERSGSIIVDGSTEQGARLADNETFKHVARLSKMSNE